MMRFTRDAEIALTEAYQPQGINVGINLGRAAGAGIARPPPHPPGAALDRRHELHVGGRRTSRAARGPQRDRDPPATVFARLKADWCPSDSRRA